MRWSYGNVLLVTRNWKDVECTAMCQSSNEMNFMYLEKGIERNILTSMVVDGSESARTLEGPAPLALIAATSDSDEVFCSSPSSSSVKEDNEESFLLLLLVPTMVNVG